MGRNIIQTQIDDVLAPCCSNVSSCVCSLGLYQWSEAVIRRVVRLWDIRGGEMVRHQVHVLVTPRVVVRDPNIPHLTCP